MRISRHLAISLGLILVAIGATAAAQAAEGLEWTTDFRGDEMCLEVVEDGPAAGMTRLARCDHDAASQEWFLRPGAGGYSSWTTELRGPRMCLDVINGGEFNNFTKLERCGSLTGQHWRARPISGGAVQFTTEFRGERMCLDVVNGGRMNNYTRLTRCDDLSGQAWNSHSAR